MITVEHIEDWRGKEVRDPNGQSLGKLQEVFFDIDSGTPLLVSIKTGLLGRHTKLIPIDGAGVGPDYVRVAHDKHAIEESPDGPADEPPNAVALDNIASAYGLRFSDRVRLESAGTAEARRAETEAARRRAEELDAQAREKIAAHEEARARAEGASDEVEQAELEAEEARAAARRAREDARRHDPGA